MRWIFFALIAAATACSIDPVEYTIEHMQAVCDACGYTDVSQFLTADPCTPNQYCYCASIADCWCYNVTETALTMGTAFFPDMEHIVTALTYYSEQPNNFTDPAGCDKEQIYAKYTSTVCASCTLCGFSDPANFYDTNQFTGCVNYGDLCTCLTPGLCECTALCNPTPTCPTQTTCPTTCPTTGPTPSPTNSAPYNFLYDNQTLLILSQFVFPIISGTVSMGMAFFFALACVRRYAREYKRVKMRNPRSRPPIFQTNQVNLNRML